MEQETEVDVLRRHPVVRLVAARMLRYLDETMMAALTFDGIVPKPAFAEAALNYYTIKVGLRGTGVTVTEHSDSVARAVLRARADMIGIAEVNRR